MLHIAKIFFGAAIITVGYSSISKASDAPIKESLYPIASILREVDSHNQEFVADKENTGYFSRFQDSQAPKMALVGCGDSRVHMHAVSGNPDNNIFALRNLSAQFKSGEAGLIFAANHLHTPIIVFMGHGDCGAVATKTQLEWVAQETKLPLPSKASELEPWAAKVIAALKKGKYAYLLDWFQGLMAGGKASFPLVAELGNVKVARAAIAPPPGSSQEKFDRFHQIVHENTKYNTHYQVNEAHKRFAPQVKAGTLIIAGALYDFQDREKQGKGRVIWIDARDAKTNPEKATVTRVGGRAAADKSLPPMDIPSQKCPVYKVSRDIDDGVERLKKLQRFMPYAGPHQLQVAK